MSEDIAIPMESIPHRYQRKINNKYFFLYFLFHILFQLNSPHASKSILHSIFNKQLVLSHLPKAGFAIFLLWTPIALFFLLNYHWSVSMVRRLWDGDTQKGILLESSLAGQQARGSKVELGCNTVSARTTAKHMGSSGAMRTLQIVSNDWKKARA